MLSLGMESILVGGVVDGVSDIGGRVDIAEATANSQAGILRTGIHQLGRLLTALTIRQLVTEVVSVNADIV